jgi:2-polyprenyl-3-methyl-5-hydroxy-6-metoxy-1,4-benzoquinol methylase
MVIRKDYIIEQCKSKKVLHVGCCDTPLMHNRIKNNNLLHFQLLQVTRELYGIDISKEDIIVLQEKYKIPNLTVGDCERVSDYFPNIQFDVVVASELLEHLNNPGNFLTSLKSLLHISSTLVISVPNGVAFRRGINSILRRETVHSDHNFYFSRKTISGLLMRHGYEVTDIHGYRIMDKKFILSYISDFFASLFSEFACEGIVLSTKLAEN